MILGSTPSEKYTLQELEEFWGDKLSELTPQQRALIAWLFEQIQQASAEP